MKNKSVESVYGHFIPPVKPPVRHATPDGLIT